MARRQQASYRKVERIEARKAETLNESKFLYENQKPCYQFWHGRDRS
jgi:hypothetical protein